MRLGCVVLDLRVMVGTGCPHYERLRFNSYRRVGALCPPCLMAYAWVLGMPPSRKATFCLGLAGAFGAAWALSRLGAFDGS